jgi:hypothetical protein
MATANAQAISRKPLPPIHRLPKFPSTLVRTTRPLQLHRQARHIAIRAENAAVPRQGFQLQSTRLAVIDILARVRRHSLGRAVTAPGARDRRIEIKHRLWRLGRWQIRAPPERRDEGHLRRSAVETVSLSIVGRRQARQEQNILASIALLTQSRACIGENFRQLLWFPRICRRDISFNNCSIREGARSRSMRVKSTATAKIPGLRRSYPPGQLKRVVDHTNRVARKSRWQAQISHPAQGTLDHRLRHDRRHLQFGMQCSRAVR